VATHEGGAVKFHYNDHLSARVTSDAAGVGRTGQGHFPYGESWYNTSGAKWLFTSYERDSESGNDYAIFRTHFSRLGRFNAPDQVLGRISNPQRLNRYAYVMGNPINFTDRLGLDMQDVAMAGPTGGGPCDVENTPDPDACMRRLLQAIASGGLQEGSLLRRPDIMPSLNIFDAMKIYYDPDDGDGYVKQGDRIVPANPSENDCWKTYGFLCTTGVVSIQTGPSEALHPNAGFLRPNTDFTINLGQIRPGVIIPKSPTIWEFFSGKPDPRVPPPFWFWPPPEQPPKTGS
jgi:RHS repeat-associated protein